MERMAFAKEVSRLLHGALALLAISSVPRIGRKFMRLRGEDVWELILLLAVSMLCVPWLLYLCLCVIDMAWELPGWLLRHWRPLLAGAVVMWALSAR